MTIQTQFGQAAAAISPFKANFTNPADAVWLVCILTRDDLVSSCDILCKLLGADGSKYYEKTVTISGDDYTNWNGNNGYCFTYAGNAFNLTFI